MSGRTIVVTGGFGALGAVVGRVFAQHGDRVALLGRKEPPAQLVAEFAQQHFVKGGVDLADRASAESAMQAVVARLGRLDVLVNVAGGFKAAPLQQSGPQLWDVMYAMNLKTTVCASHAALPHLLARGQGSIVNVSAAAALERARVGMGAYTSSKSGVLRFTESLADELKDRGITVNAVLPGTIDTPQNRADMPNADVSRWVAPESIAEVIVFLASDSARAVTGAAIPVRGRG
jgi:NAD(P)-dependent dehydrogenase (short-subunit alcohol dehydrogenase family)